MKGGTLPPLHRQDKAAEYDLSLHRWFLDRRDDGEVAAAQANRAVDHPADRLRRIPGSVALPPVSRALAAKGRRT